MFVLFVELTYINIEVVFRVYALNQNAIKTDLNTFDKPMIPFFFSFMAISAGQYEGNPIIPAIYANSKNK